MAACPIPCGDVSNNAAKKCFLRLADRLESRRRKTALSRIGRSSFVDRERAHSTLLSRLARRVIKACPPAARQNAAGDFLFRNLRGARFQHAAAGFSPTSECRHECRHGELKLTLQCRSWRTPRCAAAGFSPTSECRHECRHSELKLTPQCCVVAGVQPDVCLR